MINEHVTMIHRKKKEVLLNKPILIGAIILDLSKLHMYNLWYNVLKPIFGDRLELCMTDTDSFFFSVNNCTSWQKEIIDAGYSNEFDFSGYADDHPISIFMKEKGLDKERKDNDNVLGKFKDEANGKKIAEFVGLKAKMYSYIYDESEASKLKEDETLWTSKAKGVSKAVIKHHITQQDYVSCSNVNQQSSINKANNITIRSKGQELYTTSTHKITLSPSDSKVYLVDSIHTLPYGHFRINELT